MKRAYVVIHHYREEGWPMSISTLAFTDVWTDYNEAEAHRQQMVDDGFSAATVSVQPVRLIDGDD